MDKTLYCILDPVVATQDIFLGNNEDPQSINPITTCPATELFATLSSLATLYDVHRIRLFGNKDYIEGLIKKYPIENVEIEVN